LRGKQHAAKLVALGVFQCYLVPKVCDVTSRASGWRTTRIRASAPCQSVELFGGEPPFTLT